MLYIVVKPENFMSTYILGALVRQCPQVRLVEFAKTPSHGLDKVRKFLRAFVVRRRGLWLSHFYPQPFLDALAAAGPEDTVLFFAVKHLKDLCILDREVAAARKSVYLWDPLSSICRGPYRRWEYRTFVGRLGMDIYTFDPVDAATLGVGYLPQVYRRPDAALTAAAAPASDVFFIGQDKHRSRQLARVAALLSEAGLTADLHIFRDRHTQEEPSLRPYYTDSRVPYEATLPLVAASRCLLELVQKGQHGLTLRVMEALFMQKKLMTNNAAVISYDFYHPDNILVLTPATTAADVARFMARPMHPIAADVVARHDISVWIRHFLDTDKHDSNEDTVG